MRSRIGLMLLLLVSSSCQGAAESENDVDVLHQVPREAFDALLEGDITALDSLWAPEWVFSSPRGQVISREGFLDLFASGAIRYDSIADLEAEVRDYGDAAVMLGTVRIWYTAPDGPHEENLRYTTMYARPEWRWQMVAWQSTLIEDEP